MDIERLKELADCDVFIGGNPIVVDRAQETLRTLIDEAIKTETTGCHYCRGIESPFGSCDFCGYEFNSELINEYEITHCPKCGEEIEESIDLGW